MSRRRRIPRLLALAFAVAALAGGGADVEAATNIGPGPCPGLIQSICVPLPPGGIQLPGPPPRPSPSPTPSASPTAQPGPTPAPLPGPAVPTDVGFNALATKVYAGGSWFLPHLFPMLSTPMGDSNWFLELYRRMENIGALLLLLFLVLGLVTALIQRDLTLMLKVPFLYLPVAIGVTVIAIQLTQLLMAVADGFTVYTLQLVGQDLDAAFAHAAAVLAAAAAGTALTGQVQAAAALVGATILLAAMGIALELLARTAAIYVCLAFLPVTAACLLWPKLASLPKLLVEVLIGLILLKWVVAVVLVLAVKAFEANPFTMGPQGDPGFVTILMGAVMLVIAAVGSPLTLVKAIPWVEGQVVGHWSGQMRRTVATAVAVRRIDPKRLQKALQEGRDGAAGALPVKTSQGRQPRVIVLPRGAQLFVRTPRSAKAGGGAGARPRRSPAPPPRGGRSQRRQPPPLGPYPPPPSGRP